MSNSQPQNRIISLSVPADLVKWIDAAAEREARSRSQLASHLMREALEARKAQTEDAAPGTKGRQHRARATHRMRKPA